MARMRRDHYQGSLYTAGWISRHRHARRWPARIASKWRSESRQRLPDTMSVDHRRRHVAGSSTIVPMRSHRLSMPVGAGGQSLPPEWRAVAALRAGALRDDQTAGETGTGATMPAETCPSRCRSRDARNVTARRENAHVGAASARMLAFSVAAWHQSLTVDRATRSPVPPPESTWRAPERDGTAHDRGSIAIQESRVLIRETMRMMGVHLRRTGVRPEHFVPMLRGAIHRTAEQRVAGPEFTRLARDAVTWGIEGYYAGQTPKSVREPLAGDLRTSPSRIPKRWPGDRRRCWGLAGACDQHRFRAGESSSNDTRQEPGSNEHQNDARANQHGDVHDHAVAALATRDHEGPEGIH